MSDLYVDDDTEQHDDDLTVEREDDTPLIRKLRRDLKAAQRKGKRVDDLESKVRTLEGAQTLASAGLDKLTERQRQTLLREVGDEVTTEKLREAAIELGWAEAEPDPAEADVDEHDAISRAGKGAQGKGSSEITPQAAASWDHQRRREFMKQHPAEWDALKKGETVRGVTF